MTTGVYTSGGARKAIYITAAVVFIVLVIIGLITFRSAKVNAEAEEKADQLIAALTAAGLPAPPKQQITRLLGDDGGAVCTHPNESLARATLYSQFTNGAGGPGQRPVIIDSKIVEGEAEILKVYCPDKYPSYQEFVSKLKTADVAKA